jgi:hypothetical protein
VGCLGRLAPDVSNPSVKSISSPVRLPPWIMGEFASDLYGILDDVDVVLNPITARLVDSSIVVEPVDSSRPKGLGIQIIDSNVEVDSSDGDNAAAIVETKEVDVPESSNGSNGPFNNEETVAVLSEKMVAESPLGIDGSYIDGSPEDVEWVKVDGMQASSSIEVNSSSEVYELIRRRHSEATVAGKTDAVDTPSRFILLAGLRASTNNSKRKNSSGSESSFNLFHNRRSSMDDVDAVGRRTTRSFLFSHRKQSEFRLPLDDIMRYPGSIAPNSDLSTESRNCFSIAVIENDRFSLFSYNSSQSYLENLSTQLMQLGKIQLISYLHLVAWNVIRMQYMDRVVPAFEAIKDVSFIPTDVVYMQKNIGKSAIIVQIGISGLYACVNVFTIENTIVEDQDESIPDVFNKECEHVRKNIHLFSCKYCPINP